jgi:hypothetical protein
MLFACPRKAKEVAVVARDDARALTFGGFSIGMVEHDRAAASEAFEAGVALSPSSAFTYIMGSIVRAWSGEAERAIEWAENPDAPRGGGSGGRVPPLG